MTRLARLASTLRSRCAGLLLTLAVGVAPSAAPLGAAVSIGGRVSAAGTSGLAGARVSLLPLEDPHAQGLRLLAGLEPEPLATAVTDESGLFRLRASDRGGVAVLVESAFEEARATLTLAGPGGRPFRQILSGALRDRFPLYRGRVQVTGLPPGTWTVHVESDDGRTLTGSASTEAAAAAAEVVLE